MYSGNETFLIAFKCCMQLKTEDSEKLNELVSLENQVKVVRLQDKLGKQNFHEDMKKVFEPVTKSLENTSQDITKTITESSIRNNKAIENLNNKLLEIMNGRGILASFLMSPSSEITNPENSSQFKLVKDPNSNRVNDLLIHNTIPTRKWHSESADPAKALDLSLAKQTNRQTKNFR